MKLGKWLVVLLLVASALAGCAKKESGGDSASSSPGASQAAETKEEKPQPVTFTYFNAFSGKDVLSTDTEIGKIYAEKTGVTWKIEHLVGDLKTKIGTMIASGQYPDVLVPDTEIDKVVEAGAFIPLEDLIEKYAPNIKRVYGKYYPLMRAKDGHIYFLPFSPQVGEFKPSPTIDQGAFWIQKRVLKEFNYPKVKTLDEYLNLIREYIKKHPNEGLIGFTALTHDWRFFVITNPPNHLAGYPNDGGVMVDMKTMQANDYTDDDVSKRWFQTLNQLYLEGLFDETSFVNNYDQYLAKLTSGKVLGFFDYGWQVNQAFQNIRKAGNPDLEYFPLPIVFDANIKDQYLDPPTFVNNRGIGITVSAKDPVRIIKFFDFMLNEENQILNQWGIKGVTYEVDSNGRFYRTKEQIEKLKDNEYSAKIGFTYFSYAWPMYGQSSTLSDGNAVAPGRQPEVAQMSFTDSDKEFLSKYGVKTFSEMFSPPDERPWYPAWSISLEQGSPAQIFTQKKDQLLRRYVPRMVMAKQGEFEKIWNEFVTEFRKLDVKAYEDTMTQKIKEKAAKVKGEAQ